MPHSELVTEIKKRTGSYEALARLRQTNQQIPVAEWNRAMKEAV